MLELNRLYNMDCIEGMKLIPDKSIHCIVTDPPYGLEYNQNDLASCRESVFGGKMENQRPNGIINDGEEYALKLFEDFLKESKRILIKGGCCCCCCCGGGGPKPLFAKWTLLMDQYIGFKQAVIWDKGGLGMGIHYRRNYEFVLIAQKGNPAYAWNGGNDTPNVWRINKIIPSSEQHPTEKPIKLMGKIIHLHSNEGDTILDPFAGSGVTLVAAMNQGRNFMGFEIDPKFYKMATDRINNHVRQTDIFNEKKQDYIQTGLF
jgi:site-specific DNA-methyltransferase (adenine-specific)